METKYIVNNSTGQTINGNITINGNLIVTGDTSIEPYKVYTSYLTQSGSSEGLSRLDSGNLTKGVTYQISGNDGDFSNVGAPNNDDGTYFVAINNETPIYNSSSLNYDNAAPVTTVLENTIGNVFLRYISQGVYNIITPTSSRSNFYFTIGNTLTDKTFNLTYLQDGETFEIFTGDDNRLNYTPIEIRVYN